jgi:hypothetical protein
MDFEKRISSAMREMSNLKYKPKAFMAMVAEFGAVNAVKKVVNSNDITEGFTRLWELKRLDLSMENIIQEAEWENLFTEEERQKSKRRLAEYGFKS